MEKTQSDVIKEFLAACGFDFGLAIFKTREGQIVVLDTTSHLMDRIALAEMLHDGVRTEIRRMNLNRLDQMEKESKDGAPK